MTPFRNYRRPQTPAVPQSPKASPLLAQQSGRGQPDFAILKSRNILENRFILQVQQHIHPFWTKAQVQFHTDGEHFQYQDLF